MADETVVRGFRLKTKTLETLDAIREKKYGPIVKLNGFIQLILDNYIKKTKPSKK